MNITAEDLIFAGAVAAALASVWFIKTRTPPSAILHQWAKENGCAILYARYREIALGPFGPGSLRKGQVVFHVILCAADGVKRAAWVRYDSNSGPENVEVVWGATSSKPPAEARTQAAK